MTALQEERVTALQDRVGGSKSTHRQGEGSWRRLEQHPVTEERKHGTTHLMTSSEEKSFGKEAKTWVEPKEG